jgi:prepilin-type N-terminal cleavage/methylation domain-containing protein
LEVVLKLKKLIKGFTLVEIIIVVAIISLLAVLIIRALINQTNKANDAKRKADIQQIRTAFEEYYSDEECYPPETIISNCGGSELKPYLNSIPCDPVYHTPYCYITDTDMPACFQKYRLLGTLKNLSDLIIKSLGCDSGQYCGWESQCGADGNRFGYNYGLSSLNSSLLNPNVNVDITPPPLPTPGGGSWGCTPGGDCNNYGPGSPLCDYQFSNESCGNGLYCQYSIYRCSR